MPLGQRNGISVGIVWDAFSCGTPRYATALFPPNTQAPRKEIVQLARQVQQRRFSSIEMAKTICGRM